MTADLYARLSRETPDQTSIGRQVAACRNTALARGSDIGVVHEDLDFSAYTSIVRPGYEALRRRIERHEITEVIFWKIDRVARNTREFLGFVDLCERHGVAVVSVTEQIDTSSPIGRVLVTILAAFAELESATIGLRVRSARLLEASAGRPHMGGRRRFGYTREMDIDPAEAELVRSAARDVLSGTSAAGIARMWNLLGAGRVVNGGTWAGADVMRLLRQPHLAGLRSHKGEITEGAWPAILDRATHEALCARPRAAATPTRRSYMLTGGVLRCGRCGAKLVGGVKSGYRTYSCQKRPGHPGCGRMSAVALPLEKIVTDLVLEALRRRSSGSAVRQDSERDSAAETAILTALKAVEDRMVEAGEDYAAGLLPRSAFQAAAAALQAEVDELSKRLVVLGEVNVLASVGADPAAEWERRDVEWRAKLVTAVFEKIELLPARKKGVAFSQERLKFYRA